MEQVQAEWAERIEMDSVIPEKGGKGSQRISAAAAAAYEKVKKKTGGH